MDRRFIFVGLAALALGGSGAAAQPTHRPPTSSAEISLARRQITAGDLTQALATLERAILARPGDGEARLLHASVLCRLDDPSGSLVEFDRLRGWDFAPALWREATEPCEAMREGDRR